MGRRAGGSTDLRCSFCGKAEDKVAQLISSPTDRPRAYICDECVSVCYSILEDDRGMAEAAPGHESSDASLEE
jgi:ATP-dependent Clp protease ATP-binding subunit ClpX